MKVLVTGGAGYLGSHACVELLAAGYEVVVVDNLTNSDLETLNGIAEIAAKAPRFVRGDILDQELMIEVMRANEIEAVLHFAALKSPEESCRRPLDYFRNNACGTASLVQAMEFVGVDLIVFSSSAAVYGHAAVFPIAESAPAHPVNPYGRSKLVCEQLLSDMAVARPSFRAAALRYFNPVGAHASGLIGERAGSISGSLVPCLVEVASGRRECLTVFGRDYPTIDGTGVRDYVHVVDVARAHVHALRYLADGNKGGALNLGTGRGLSVLEVVAAFECASGCRIPLRFADRRQGDVASSYADPALAESLLGWRAELGIERMCGDAWSRYKRLCPA
jgi:UDP-glucose 4-epimerase